MAGLHELASLVDVELHAVELAQEVVREFDIGLVDFIDQQHRLRIRLERFPELAFEDVVTNVVHPLVAQLRVAQARNGVVLVESLLRLRGGLDVPLEQRTVERAGDLLCKLGFAGAGLAFDEERPCERDGRVDGHHQVVRGDVAVRAGETSAHDRGV